MVEDEEERVVVGEKEEEGGDKREVVEGMDLFSILGSSTFFIPLLNLSNLFICFFNVFLSYFFVLIF